jgi:hypothetical protein
MYRFLSFFLIVCLLAVPWVSVGAQEQDYQYFEQTGHNVKGEFLKFYRSASDPTLLYGYPITEEIISKDGKHVQYFQRARFEYYPDRPEGQRVELTPLGSATYVPGTQLNFFSPFACRTYSQTGYAVCFTFLEFFDKYGGVAQFGYPISPFEYHDNVLVQYFEKARLEWQPWRPDGQRVVVSDLGRVYFDKLGEDPSLLPPVPPLSAGFQPPILALQVRAFVWKAVTLSSDQQLIFLIVQDQRSQPVANADCSATVHWPDGRIDTIAIKSNSNGVAIVPLSYSNQPYGSLIYTDVSCTTQGVTGKTTTSFRIWY